MKVTVNKLLKIKISLCSKLNTGPGLTKANIRSVSGLLTKTLGSVGNLFIIYFYFFYNRKDNTPPKKYQKKCYMYLQLVGYELIINGKKLNKHSDKLKYKYYESELKENTLQNSGKKLKVGTKNRRPVGRPETKLCFCWPSCTS